MVRHPLLLLCNPSLFSCPQFHISSLSQSSYVVCRPRSCLAPVHPSPYLSLPSLHSVLLISFSLCPIPYSFPPPHPPPLSGEFIRKHHLPAGDTVAFCRSEFGHLVRRGNRRGGRGEGIGWIAWITDKREGTPFKRVEGIVFSSIHQAVHPSTIKVEPPSWFQKPLNVMS